MLSDEITKALDEIFTKVKIPMKVREIFLYRPVYHELPFEDFEPITDPARLAVCDPLCIEFSYEFNGYNFAYHLECANSKGDFSLKEKWLKNSDIYPNDAKDNKVNETQITEKSRIDLFSSLLLRMLSLSARDQH